MWELDILKWAAGSSQPFEQPPAVDTSRLLALVRANRLEGRFIRRLREARPHWATDEFVDQVAAHYSNALNSFRMQVNTLQEIGEVLPVSAAPPIAIKGFSTFVLTRNPAVLHRSGDIDVLAPNPAALVAKLLDLGYKSWKAPTLHDFANLRRGSLDIDIHQYFPIWSYRRDDESTAIEYRALTYQDLAAPGTTAIEEVHTWRVPNHAAAALIACANVFKDFLCFWSYMGRRRLPIRLGDLADIWELAQHKAFDRELFWSSVERWHAEDAVAFVDFLLAVYLGVGLGTSHQPHGAVGSVDTISKRFPRSIWGPFVADINEPIAELVLHEVAMSRLVESLEGDKIPMAGKVRCSARGGDGEHQIKRVLTHGADDGGARNVVIEVLLDDEAIELIFDVDGDLRNTTTKFRVDFGGTALVEYWHRGNDGAGTSKGADAEINVQTSEGGLRVRIRCPWQVVGLPPAAHLVPALLGVAREADDHHTSRSILVPVQFERA